MNFAKVVFYFFLLLFNVISLTLIGTSFLLGHSVGGEGAIALTTGEVIFRHCFYVLLVSIVFSGLIFLLGLSLRKRINFTIKGLLILSISELIFFMITFVVVYLVVYT